MKKLLITGLLIILLFILDNTVMPFLAIYNYYPSILFVFIMCFSIINGKWQGLWVGVVAGLLQDIFFGNAFGINSLLNMLLCVLAGEIGLNIFKNKRFIPIVSTLGLSVLKGICIYGVLRILGQHTNIYTALYKGIYEMFICLLIYRRMYKLYNRNYMKKEWKF